MTSYLWQFKCCSHLPCKFPVVIMARDLLQFSSPGQHVYLFSMPWYPFHIFHGGRFGIIGHQNLWEAILHSCASQKHLLPTQELLQLGHSNSSSPPFTLNKSESSHIAPSVPQVSRGIWWALSTLESLSGLLSDGERVSPQ